MSVAFCIGHRNYGHTKWCENLYVIYKVCDIQNGHLEKRKAATREGAGSDVS